MYWLGRRTCDQQVASSTPGRALLVSTLVGDSLCAGINRVVV